MKVAKRSSQRYCRGSDVTDAVLDCALVDYTRCFLSDLVYPDT